MLGFNLTEEKLTEISSSNILQFIVVYLCVMFSIRFFDVLAYVIAAFVLMAALRRQPTVCFYALLIVPCLNIMNWVIFRVTTNYSFASKMLTLLLCIMLIQQASLLKERYHVLRPFAFLICYTLLMLVLSPFSLVPLISSLKALLFLGFIGALIAMVSLMLNAQVHPGRARSVVLAVCCIFILGSLAVWPFPQISRSMILLQHLMGWSDELDDTYGLYNGVTFHSQTLGPLLAVLNAFLLSDYLFNLKRGGGLHKLLLCGIPILVYLTSSRTALLTYLGSIFVVWLLLSRSRRVPATRKAFMHGFLAVVFVLATVGLLVSSGFRNNVTDFLAKNRSNAADNRGNESVVESLQASRLGMITQQMESFHKHPLIGTGFQVSEDLVLRRVEKLEDLLSAPVEKGVLPTMILEESGLLGALIMLGFFLSVLTTFMKRNCYGFLATFAAFFLTNMGEATFFSISGNGGIMWTVCFCALLLDLHRIRYDTTRSRPAEAFGTQANWTFG